MVNVTVKVDVAPAAMVIVDGLTATSTPGGALHATEYVPAGPTFRTVRLTVWTPASWAMPIEARLRSLGSIVPIGVVHGAAVHELRSSRRTGTAGSSTRAEVVHEARVVRRDRVDVAAAEVERIGGRRRRPP